MWNIEAWGSWNNSTGTKVTLNMLFCIRKIHINQCQSSRPASGPQLPTTIFNLNLIQPPPNQAFSRYITSISKFPKMCTSCKSCMNFNQYSSPIPHWEFIKNNQAFFAQWICMVTLRWLVSHMLSQKVTTPFWRLIKFKRNFQEEVLGLSWPMRSFQQAPRHKLKWGDLCKAEFPSQQVIGSPNVTEIFVSLNE